MSCSSGGNGEGALSSAEGAVVKAGRSRACDGDGSRRVGSMGDARYIKGAKVDAVLAVARSEQLLEAILLKKDVTFEIHSDSVARGVVRWCGMGGRKWASGLGVTAVVQSREGLGKKRRRRREEKGKLSMRVLMLQVS
ncbi:hypothetical protein MMC08_001330 [Hypocenomyce scalaris]|nr:hypothetical protein [Hypocenomyce scalaris]